MISSEKLFVNAFSLPHACGYLKSQRGEAAPFPVRLDALADYARRSGLAGVDAPLPTGGDIGRPAPWHPPPGCRLVVEGPDLHALPDSSAIAWIQSAAQSGARTVRFIVSPILCGERRGCAVGWEFRLRAIEEKLARLLPIAEAEGVALCLENHQDLDSEDLLRLADAVHAHPSFGVVFDTGNPLAVAEEPVEFLRRVAPLVRHVHLKDYRLHQWEHGWRLCRCPAGQGVVPFDALTKVLEERAVCDWTAGIEVAAQPTRSIRACDPQWMAGFPGRGLESFGPVLSLLLRKGIPSDQPYGSAWESGAASDVVLREEWQVLEDSVAYFLGKSRGVREDGT